jgi:dTDP-4-dehydrorhamnose reductase
LGANGQLGHDLSQRFSNKGVKFLQVTRSDVDIANLDALELFLDDKDFSVLVNCTSYHKTDEVEDNAPNAFLINSSAPMLMAQICQKKRCKNVPH